METLHERMTTIIGGKGIHLSWKRNPKIKLDEHLNRHVPQSMVLDIGKACKRIQVKEALVLTLNTWHIHIPA